MAVSFILNLSKMFFFLCLFVLVFSHFEPAFRQQLGDRNAACLTLRSAQHVFETWEACMLATLHPNTILCIDWHLHVSLENHNSSLSLYSLCLCKL